MAETRMVGETPEEARAELLRVQDEYGPPTREGGWTEAQHAHWDAQWRHWRALVMAKHGYDEAA
ncbi:hypothetical protein ACFUT3_31555 [Streptomyces cinereoruber]|uniref:hypothetical protein n=1 Tax=Streptomyces cinereoruber TaxID=67260 RepID=UPI00363899AA